MNKWRKAGYERGAYFAIRWNPTEKRNDVEAFVVVNFDFDTFEQACEKTKARRDYWIKQQNKA